jgi:hypothetical protein
MSAADLLSRLDKVRQAGVDRWSARCPAHEDEGPSLSIRELSDGRVLVHCFAMCPVEDVLGAVGLDFDALFPPRAQEYAQRIKKPWRASDVVRALEYELTLAAIALGDIEHDRPMSNADRIRCGQCRERILRFAEELANAA